MINYVMILRIAIGKPASTRPAGRHSLPFSGFPGPCLRPFPFHVRTPARPHMSLRPEDVQRIAHLARLAITKEEGERTLGQLNDIFGMIERMRAVDTEGVVPMSHPLGGAQRLRADVVTDIPDRERNLANAPARQDGLFLVPRVLE